MATSDSIPTAGHGLQLDAHQIFQHESLRTQRQPSGSSSTSSTNAAMRGKRKSLNRRMAHSSPSRNTQSSTSTHAENCASQRDVRTLPPWIDSYEEGEEILNSKPTDRLLAPSRVHPPQHQFVPSNLARRMSQDGFVDTYDDVSGLEKKPETGFFGGHKEPVKGRKWDHARDGDPVIMQSLSTSSPWRMYIKSSMYGPAQGEDGKVVNPNFLQQQTPGYQKPWRGDLERNGDPEKGLLHNKKKQKSMMRKVQHNLLMHPLVPLVFRVTVLITSVVALGLSTSVHHLSNKYFYPQNPSTTMAIVVDIVAIPYILYITWDEYTGKPLGLRSPKAKIRLVLLDLFFIIFESANLALAFAALTDDNGSCKEGSNGTNHVICGRVGGLCGILMVALVAWSLTFAVSIFRLVERVGGREGSD
ncbi:hypothetical protein F5882DRAFT_404631 [Hyaloscypha sp. PMI_1271]|nr:hypothetical protein F5882DRAFT_404631 [Hyaloscypha sp. PMI_1271]